MADSGVCILLCDAPSYSKLLACTEASFDAGALLALPLTLTLAPAPALTVAPAPTPNP